MADLGLASSYEAFNFNTPLDRDLPLPHPIDNFNAAIDPLLFPELPLGQQNPPFQSVPDFGMNGYPAFPSGGMPPIVPNMADYPDPSDQGAAADGGLPPQLGGQASWMQEYFDFDFENYLVPDWS
jgi:hypothetical protein